MKTETKTALDHFLANSGKPVSEALRKEAEACWKFNEEIDGFTAPCEVWGNDRWQAAWRELGRISDWKWLIGKTHEFEQPFFTSSQETLTGDELADALRDWALGETK